jgi:hypothetical protein
VLLLAAVVLPALGAAAHPAGEVPRARLAVADDVVTLDWIATPDDAAAVLADAGIWPEEVAARYLDVAFGGSADQLPSAGTVRAASGHPALAAHLAEHVRLDQDGRPCPVTVHPTRDLLADGVRLSFRCPAPPGRVSLTISLLHDRDPAYRTFSLDGTRRVAIHTVSEPTHPWDLGLHAPAPRVIGVLLGAAFGAVGLGGLGLRRVWRHR